MVPLPQLRLRSGSASARSARYAVVNFVVEFGASGGTAQQAMRGDARRSAAWVDVDQSHHEKALVDACCQGFLAN